MQINSSDELNSKNNFKDGVCKKSQINFVFLTMVLVYFYGHVNYFFRGRVQPHSVEETVFPKNYKMYSEQYILTIIQA